MKPIITRRLFFKKSSVLGVIPLFDNYFTASTLFKKPLNKMNNRGQVNNKICQIKKEIRIACPELSLAPMTGMHYIGQGMRLEETLRFMQSSDYGIMNLRRTSDNNGRTWSEWVPIPNEGLVKGQFTQEGGANQGGTGPYDPISDRLVKPVFQRIFEGVPQIALKEMWKGNRLYWDHGFYQLSGDNGKSWGEPYQLKYEEGPDYNPSDWGNQDWLKSNGMYIGNNSIVLKNGSVVISATIPVSYRNEEDEKYPIIPPNCYGEGKVGGAVCFVGRWNKASQNYSWEKSNIIFLPRQVSSRGLMELELSELTNGNLLLIMRGSNDGRDITKAPGRKWFSVSKDGGLTWGDISDMRYDSGEQFYSPSSFHRTIRSSKTGKLYWIGNICNEPPKGNRPRYPLQIVEVDEDSPSFRKDTVTVIDDRDPEHDHELIQLSNFSLLENRETQDIEIYMTRLGENIDTWRANAYKYTLVF